MINNLKNSNKWKSIIEEIFNTDIPDSFMWVKQDEIITILNAIGTDPSSNRMFCQV